MTPIIEFKNVSKKFDQKLVIDQLDLSINKGEIFVLVGPSGSGKTTTLKMINALSEPTDGDIYFKEKRIKEYNIQKMRWQMGYVLQQIALFPTMDVKQNIEVIPEMLGWSKKDRSEAVDRLLTQVKLDPEQYRHRMPKELSGGEQQRIGILRALAANSEIILMDEPFSALDPISRNSLQDLVLDLHKELGTTIIFVTHNMKEAVKLGTRIAVMNQGKIVQCDTPEVIVSQPKTAFVKSFFEETGEDEAKLVTAGDLIRMNFFSNDINQADPKIAASTPLNELYTLFARHDTLVIEENQQLIGSLRRKDVFAFLSRDRM
ncbi:ABC transporter ATP-binding protein [Enterococcus casseliflavus]|uniref:ABC transporter ATP-binding protein n=1 Tax=Enterococcus casseliflavus TaxID=37734 RepID=UPI000763C07D|nr:ABC transporter ATP-binding protein [Enterococcus casseliflavus]QQU22356.1 ABC transporter ATP-binding protein [Enterococcus casseliflavus]STQ30870.1 ABC transporter ATP-binding protein [Enterococcus casseliflavus]